MVIESRETEILTKKKKAKSKARKKKGSFRDTGW